MKNPFEPRVIPVAEKLPPVDQRVMVICKGFRCLGFLDRDQIWRDVNRRTELHDIIGWYALES